MTEETVDVVQTVVRFDSGKGYRYLIGLRSHDKYWEFLGGKVENGETLKEAGIRELNEETDLELSKSDITEYREGESYRSAADDKYRLNPVLIEIRREKAEKMSGKGLSSEHLDYEWIKLNEFYSFGSLGQYRALENLEITEGDVALAILEKDGELLVLKRSEETSSSGKWNFPGGKIEENEDREEAALRELREETSLEGEILESGDPYLNDGELGHWRIFTFLVEAEGEVELNSEHSDYRWLKPGKVEDLETLGTFRGMKNLDSVRFPEAKD
ncbi:MAG: NUDIX domain-containing protein [Candidatus Nanosalina sp.]